MAEQASSPDIDTQTDQLLPKLLERIQPQLRQILLRLLKSDDKSLFGTNEVILRDIVLSILPHAFQLRLDQKKTDDTAPPLNVPIAN